MDWNSMHNTWFDNTGFRKLFGIRYGIKEYTIIEKQKRSTQL